MPGRNEKIAIYEKPWGIYNMIYENGEKYAEFQQSNRKKMARQLTRDRLRHYNKGKADARGRGDGQVPFARRLLESVLLWRSRARFLPMEDSPDAFFAAQLAGPVFPTVPADRLWYHPHRIRRSMYPFLRPCQSPYFKMYMHRTVRRGPILSGSRYFSAMSNESRNFGGKH